MKKNSQFIVAMVLMFLPMFLFGDDTDGYYAKDFPIYIYGDVSYLETIYKFIKAVVNDDSISYIIELGLMMAAVVSGWAIKNGDYSLVAKSLLAPVTVLGLFFTPTSTVHIVDLRVDNGIISGDESAGGGYATVQDVPYAIAMIPSSSSLLATLFIDLIDNSWNGVHIGDKFSALGYGTMREIMKRGMETQAMNFETIKTDDNNSGELKHDIAQYLYHCVFTANSSPSVEDKLKNPQTPFPTFLDPANLGINGDNEFTPELYDGGDANDSISCSNFYSNNVSGKSADIKALMKTFIQAKYPDVDIDSSDFQDSFTRYIGDINNKVGNIQTAAATVAVSRLAEQIEQKALAGTDGVSVATSLAIETSLARMRTEGPAKLEWLNRVLPETLNIIQGLIIAAFPFVVIVLTFMGAKAVGNIVNYTMGYIAFSFHNVSLVLVHNIMGFYTQNGAASTMSELSGIPFGSHTIDNFLSQQADMAGIAGVIGAASVFALTGVIFKGETAGLSAGLSAISGSFSGNIDKTAMETTKQAALEHEIDKQDAITDSTMNEAEASKWLGEHGFHQRRSGVSALQAFNDITRGASAIGAGMASKALYSGNMGQSNMQDYIKGNQVASTQSTAKMAGLGNSIASVNSAGDVSFQDGQVQAESINATSIMRGNTEGGYDTTAIGAGMAASQYAKDMGMAAMGGQVLDDMSKQLNDFSGKSIMKDALNLAQQKTANQISSEEFLSNAQQGAKKRDSLADDLNNISDEISSLESKKGTDSFGDIEETRLSQLKDLQSDLSKEWTATNDQVNADFEASKTAPSQSAIDADTASYNTPISSAQQSLDDFTMTNGDSLAAIVANSTTQAMSQIASGKGLIDTGMMNDDGTMNNSSEAQNYLKGIEAQSAQKAKQTMGFGSSANIDDVMSVAQQDGSIQGLVATDVAKLRKDTKGWGEQGIASGQSLAQVGKEMSMIGTSLGVERDKNGTQNFMDGNLHAGQKSANATIAQGEFRESLSDSQLSNVMSAVKTNTKAKEKEEYQSGRTLAEKFGKDLDKNGSFHIDGNQDQVDNIKQNNKKTSDKIDSIQNDENNYDVKDTIFGKQKVLKDDKAKEVSDLLSQIKDVPELIKPHDENMSFNHMVSNEAKGKLAGRMGNAAAFDKIDNLTDGNAFNTMAQNALYGATSQAMSTKEKIDTQGGIDNAIKVDRAESKIKAATQMDILDKNLKATGEADKGLKEPLDNLSKAIDKLASTSGTMAGAKTASDMANIAQAGGSNDFISREKITSALKSEVASADIKAKKEAKLIDDSNNITSLGKEAIALKPGEDATAMAEKVKMGRDGSQVISQFATKMAMNGKSSEEIKKAIAPFVNDDGSIKNGQDFWNTIAAQKQGVFTGHNAIMLGGGVMASGGFSDGKFTGTIKEGLSSSKDNSMTTKQGQDDKGVIKDKAKDVLSNVFGNEVATDMITAWNSGGEVLAGAGLVGAAYGGYKKFKNNSNHSEVKPNPAKNATTANATTAKNSNMNNPFNDLEQEASKSKNNISNYTEKIDESQGKRAILEQERKELKSKGNLNNKDTQRLSSLNTQIDDMNTRETKWNDSRTLERQNLETTKTRLKSGRNAQHYLNQEKPGFIKKASGVGSDILDGFKHMPLIGKAITAFSAGAVLAQAKSEFNQGNYLLSATTIAGAVEPTGMLDTVREGIQLRQQIDKSKMAKPYHSNNSVIGNIMNNMGFSAPSYTQQPIATISPQSGSVNWNSTPSQPSTSQQPVSIGKNDIVSNQLSHQQALIQQVTDTNNATNEMSYNIEDLIEAIKSK